jgi:hypothetical protein
MTLFGMNQKQSLRNRIAELEQEVVGLKAQLQASKNAEPDFELQATIRKQRAENIELEKRLADIAALSASGLAIIDPS